MCKYEQWILRNVDDPQGRCAEVTREMQGQFPELQRVRGHYLCPVWGERQHWWLQDGLQIVDPTKSQFPSGGSGGYVPWVEGAEEPKGKCLNCGDLCYGASTCICSDNCEVEFRASLM